MDQGQIQETYFDLYSKGFMASITGKILRAIFYIASFSPKVTSVFIGEVKQIQSWLMHLLK